VVGRRRVGVSAPGSLGRGTSYVLQDQGIAYSEKPGGFEGFTFEAESTECAGEREVSFDERRDRA